VHQCDFVRRGALDVDGDRAPLTIGDSHDLRPLAAFRFADASASLLGWREAPIDERFLQIQIALVAQCLSEDFEDAPQHADADPLLKPPVAGLIRRIAIRQVGPRCFGPARIIVSHWTLLPARASASTKSPRRSAKAG